MKNAVAALALLLAAATHAHARSCDSLIYSGEQHITVNGCGSDADVARLRARYGREFAVTTRGGKSYVVTDPAILKRIGEAYQPQIELGSRQAALGAQQAALGAKQAALGAEQARLALGGDDAAQRRLGERQGELGRQQGELGRRQSELGRQQEEAGRAAERKVNALLDEAIRSGAAKEIR